MDHGHSILSNHGRGHQGRARLGTGRDQGKYSGLGRWVLKRAERRTSSELVNGKLTVHARVTA